ncbi:MAG: MazG nucleotide pyrophosphohydrolase domain-containing protein [Actinomycetota bacterium]|nr:MazG nucleotide pyrophosphohydrolase domain-containing protein [Actinomycetota bacterium]
MVAEFHRSFGLPMHASPTLVISDELRQLRVDLLREEVQEFADASERRDLTSIADALADIAYVTYGAAITYGIDLDAVLREIHSSNMSKLDDGHPVLRDDGKVLKSPQYRPPLVDAVLSGQLALPL